MLIVLGVREYRHGRSHGSSADEHGHTHADGGDHPHARDCGAEAHRHDAPDHGHSNGHDHEGEMGRWGRLTE